MRQCGEPQGVQVVRQEPYHCNFNRLYKGGHLLPTRLVFKGSLNLRVGTSVLRKFYDGWGGHSGRCVTRGHKCPPYGGRGCVLSEGSLNRAGPMPVLRSYLFFCGRVQPSRVICRARARVSLPASQSCVMVLPAAVVAPLPMCTGATSELLEPMTTSSPMVV